MPPKTKSELRYKVWDGLDDPWVEDKTYTLEKGHVAYRKKCELFDIVIHEVEPKRWAFDLVIAGGEIPYTAIIEADHPNMAKTKAMAEVFDILTEGLQIFGLIYNPQTPRNEIRLKHAFVEAVHDPLAGFPVNILHGLSEDGVLYSFNKKMEIWEPVRMKTQED